MSSTHKLYLAMILAGFLFVGHMDYQDALRMEAVRAEVSKTPTGCPRQNVLRQPLIHSYLASGEGRKTLVCKYGKWV